MKQRQDGRYVKVLDIMLPNGTPKTKWFYGRSENEVWEKVANYKTEVKLGPRFKEVAQTWENEHFNGLSYNTLKCYKPALKRSLEWFGDLRVSQITSYMIDARIKQFACSSYAYKTVYHQYIVINMILRRAVIDGIIQYNPADVVSVPRRLMRKRRELPVEKDIEIIKSLKDDSLFSLMAFIVYYTGLRKGEVLGLRYEDIDKKEKLIHVRRSVFFEGNSPRIKEPKTEAGYRSGVLLDRVAALIPSDEVGYIFKNAKGELIRSSAFQKGWKRFQKSAGIECTLHQLRHAYCTMLYEAGIADKDAQELMGHANISTTRDIYTHISKNRKLYLYQQLNSII